MLYWYVHSKTTHINEEKKIKIEDMLKYKEYFQISTNHNTSVNNIFSFMEAASTRYSRESVTLWTLKLITGSLVSFFTDVLSVN